MVNPVMGARMPNCLDANLKTAVPQNIENISVPYVDADITDNTNKLGQDSAFGEMSEADGLRYQGFLLNGSKECTTEPELYGLTKIDAETALAKVEYNDIFSLRSMEAQKVKAFEGGSTSIDFTYDPKKIGKQMGKRGWTEETIQETLDNPVRTVKTRDTRWLPDADGPLDDPATAYYASDGSYVVRNDKTGVITQISNKNDPNWIAPWDVED